MQANVLNHSVKIKFLQWVTVLNALKSKINKLFRLYNSATMTNATELYTLTMV